MACNHSLFTMIDGKIKCNECGAHLEFEDRVIYGLTNGNDEKSIGEILDSYIHDKVYKLAIENKENIEVPDNLIITDSFSQVLEKLIISTIRAWNIEEEARQSNLTDNQLAENRRKERVNNGVIRPRLIEALGRMFDLAIKGKFSLKEDHVKMYLQKSEDLLNKK